MAIDTAEKRRSVAGVRRFGARVTPNTLKDAEWRQQVARIYSGIPASVRTINMRKTLSPMGTRTGDRQTHRGSLSG